jgi:N-acetyl sugar amidotransferase
MLETRPRLTFDENGICAACQWAEEKKTKIDWDSRYDELEELCDRIRGRQRYDCIVPVSGGKDSTYVAHKMKHELKLNILTVTITPPLETNLIQENMENFLSFGYDNLKITPNPKIAQHINKFGLIEQGRPLLSWTSCLNSVMFSLATTMKIPLVMFGEEGESEYGGSTKLRYTPFYDIQDAIELYTYGNNPTQYMNEFDSRELALWQYPTKEELIDFSFRVSHWSYFENWDPYRHFVFARDHYNMKSSKNRNKGTYTDYGQLDTPLYSLHTYLMYLKFGFGRCLQDACIDIRGGRLNRKDALEIVKKYDGEFLEESVPIYLNYYKITREEFNNILDKHTNKKIFEKIDSIWLPRFSIE